jgi:oxygen-dependent protoporphyrinogen oxidase
VDNKNFKKNIIVGAGIAGLSAACQLDEKKEEYFLFEKEASCGGTWKSSEYKGSIYELGPNTIIDKSEEFRKLIQKSGLESELLKSELKKSKRYFYQKNKLREVSMNPFKLINSKIISLSAKLRLLKEPFVKSKSNGNESVFDFFSRRFGKEFAQNMISPALQGVWGGDIKNLNMSCALKHLYESEQEYGSVIKGLFFSKKTKKKNKRLQTISFKKGMEDFCNKLAAKLELASIKLKTEVVKVEKEDELYKLTIRSGQNQEHYFCKNLILACQASQAGFILDEINPKLAEALKSIYYAPMFLAAYSISKEILRDFDSVFSAFGFLNNNASQFTLGTIFASSLFQERKIEDEHLFLSFIGGSKNPQIIDFSKDELKSIAINEAKEIFDSALDINIPLEEIKTVQTKLIAKAIPQYNDQYLTAKKIIDAELETSSNLKLVGNYMNGVSIVDTVEHAYTFV